jgi:hypothetical protein
MKQFSSRKITTRILWIGSVVMFLGAELVVLLTLRKIPSDHLMPGLGTRCFIAFIVAQPIIVGMNGYYSVRRRLSSACDDVISALSVQFLGTIVMAYLALLVCIGPLAQTLRSYLK